MTTEIDEIVAKVTSGKDTISSIDVVSGKASEVSSKAEVAVVKWNEDELILKVVQAILLLKYNRYKIKKNKVYKLLDYYASAVYGEISHRKNLSDLVFKCSEEMLEVPSNGVGNIITEHVPKIKDEHRNLEELEANSFKCSGNVYTINKVLDSINIYHLLYSKLLHPIYNNEYHILLGEGKSCISTSDLLSSLLNLFLPYHISSLNLSVADNLDYFPRFCNHLNGCIKQAVTSSRIHSKNTSLDYSRDTSDRRDIFDELLEREGGYKVGISSYEYKATDTLYKLFGDIIRVFSELDLKFYQTYEIQASDLILPRAELSQLNFRDTYYLLNNLVGMDKEGNYVIKNEITDRQNSRVYSLMTSIKSATREKLGFINYDISACMQTIVSHYIDISKYPEHNKLILDKHSYRNQLSEDLSMELKEVKTILTAADNGKEYRDLWKRSASLKAYIKECSSMLDDFMSSVPKELVENARVYAKTDSNGQLNKFSVFFFVWTQIEREIRMAMMSCFVGFVHEVHDAVYSKERIDNKAIEDEVYCQTGISVIIEN